MAKGEPPYSNLHPMNALFLIPKNEPPSIEGSNFSRAFREFVMACLNKNTDERVNARDLKNFRFIRSVKHKTSILTDLIVRREQWLLNHGGNDKKSDSGDSDSDSDDESEVDRYSDSDEEDNDAYATVKGESVGTSNDSADFQWVFDKRTGTVKGVSNVKGSFRHASAFDTIKKASATPKKQQVQTPSEVSDSDSDSGDGASEEDKSDDGDESDEDMYATMQAQRSKSKPSMPSFQKDSDSVQQKSPQQKTSMSPKIQPSQQMQQPKPQPVASPHGSPQLMPSQQASMIIGSVTSHQQQSRTKQSLSTPSSQHQQKQQQKQQQNPNVFVTRTTIRTDLAAEDEDVHHEENAESMSILKQIILPALTDSVKDVQQDKTTSTSAIVEARDKFMALESQIPGFASAFLLNLIDVTQHSDTAARIPALQRLTAQVLKNQENAKRTVLEDRNKQNRLMNEKEYDEEMKRLNNPVAETLLSRWRSKSSQGSMWST